MTSNPNAPLDMDRKIDSKFVDDVNAELLETSRSIQSPTKINVNDPDIGFVEFFTTSGHDDEVTVCVDRKQEMKLADFKKQFKL